MKRLIIGLIALLCFAQSFSQGNDTTKYIYYRYTYGNRLARYQADTVMQIPKDTIWSKDGIAIKGGVFYIGNGVKWTQVTGAAGATDTLSFPTWFRLYKTIDSMKAVNDARYLKIASNLSDINNAGTARTNLGLGTSAVKDVASSGNASTTQVVKGDDSRLTDSRAPSGSAGGDLAGSYPNPTIGSNKVTLAKITTGTPNTLIGYDGSGNPHEIGAGTNVTISGNQISATGGGGGGYSPTDTLAHATLTTQRALIDSARKFRYATARGVLISPGDTVVVFAHSYGNSVGATDEAHGYTGLITSVLGATVLKFAASGSTVMKQAPVDYQGASSFTERVSSLPANSNGIKAYIVDGVLNDMGQTAPAYNLTNLAAAWDTVFNYMINTLNIPPRKIFLFGEEYINSTGLATYGTITGNAAPTFARARQFDSVGSAEAFKFDINFVPMQDEIHINDSTQLTTNGVHPLNPGYAYIFGNFYQKAGFGNYNIKSTAIDSSTFVTTTHLQAYTNAAIAALSPQLIQFTVGDNGSKTPANGAATYVDSMLIGAVNVSVSQQGMTMPVGRARNAVYATFNDTTGTVTIHNGAFTDSAYYEIVGYYINKIPPTTPDDSNFIAAVIANGGTLTSNQQGYITTFFNSLKSGGLWDKILASHMLFLGSANASKFNIKNSLNTDAAFRITWHGTGTFASNGWASDGSTGYGDLHFNPSVAASQDALGFGAYVRGGSTGSTIYFIGNYDGTSITNQIGVDVSSGMVGGVNSALAGIAAQTVSSPTRLIYANRNTSGFVNYYRDGTNVAVKAQTSNTPFNGNLYLGCFNFNGTPSFFFGNTITMDFITDGSLSDADEAALNTIVNTFLTSWGINI